MHRHSINSVEAKAVLQNLESKKVGDTVDLPPAFAGLPDKTFARVTAVEGKTWDLVLVALGVEFARVRARVERNDLVMEVLK